MTNREFYETVINANINDEVTAHATEALMKLDVLNVRRREVSAEKAKEREIERAPRREAILAVMNDEPKTATTLIAEAGLADEMKPQAMPSLLKALIAEGVVVKSDVKVTGKGKQVGYAKA